MIDTVLTRSGDIYFDKSAEGCNSALPLGAPKWLNDQILVMIKAIADLDTKIPVDGRDGREIALSVQSWPIGQPPTPTSEAVCWRIVARPGDPEEKWQRLIYKHELKGDEGPIGPEGPEGPEGPKGADGTSVQFQGIVDHPSDLTHLTTAQVGYGYMVRSTMELWILVTPGPTSIKHWLNTGKISGAPGPAGPRGKTGARGPAGPKGDDGGVSAMVMDFIVSTITSTVISYVTADVTSTINGAIDAMADQLANLAEDAATAAVEKAMDDMMDEFKGEKGDKGDKGDDGKNGTSFNLVGQWNTVGEFQTRYPLIEDNVGKAALIGDGTTGPRDLWIISKLRVTPSPQYNYQNMGPMQGPKGDAAEWEISVRDKNFVESANIEVVSDLPSGVPGMFMQDTDSILIEGIPGSPADPKQVGLRWRMKYPIPTIVPDTGGLGTPTKGKVLSNDGDKLEWVDQTGGSAAKDRLLIKGADLRIWELVVDNEGNLIQQLSAETTDDTVLKLKAPSGRNFGIFVDNNGRMQISEVI